MGEQPLGLGKVSHAIRRFTPSTLVPCVDLGYPIRPRRPEDQLIKLGQTIRALRKAAGLSQEDLAYEAQIDYSTMGEIERGQRNATLVKIIRIAAALNKSMEELFAGAHL